MNSTQSREIVENLSDVPSNSGFFIDFDGTLVDIAASPELVEVDPRVRRLLEALRERFGGAVAIVTGRPLDVVDAYLAPLKLPVAAEHGAVRRDAAGCVRIEAPENKLVAVAAARLAPLAEANAGLLLERKTSSVALHYRQRPDLAEMCRLAVEEAAADLPELTVLPGKMVYELKTPGTDKGTAVSTFLVEAPFRGRVPVYIGDDLTDEHGFAVVNAAGGISVKIGEGDTVAAYRTDRLGFLAWAKNLALLA